MLINLIVLYKLYAFSFQFFRKTPALLRSVEKLKSECERTDCVIVNKRITNKDDRRECQLSISLSKCLLKPKEESKEKTTKLNERFAP